METFDGPTYALLFENLPGGPAAHLAELSYDDDPAGFLDAVLAVMKEFHPHTYDRVDLAAFALHDDKALMQGAIPAGGAHVVCRDRLIDACVALALCASRSIP